MAAVAALAAAPTPRLGASTWNSATSVSSQSVAVRIACLFRSATYGFPYHGLLSTSGDFTLGNVTSLAGMGDDTRFLQMSTPIQPGNSGGPLLDMSGAVVGVVVAQLSAVNMMLAGSSVPQNVNAGVSDCRTIAIYEYTAFCNGPVDVNCSPIVTPPSSRFCPWSAPRPPHYAVRRNGEPI